MLLNKKQATDLAKAWRLGNKFRKKSLTKKHDLAPATSKNTGRVKMGIRMDIESKPREYYPAIDDDGNLVFFTGNPMKRIPLSDLFTPPKAGKTRTRVPAKENAMINHKLETLKTSFPNEDIDILESFLEQYPFELKEFSLYKIRPLFNSFKENILERTEYQLVAQKTDGTEIKSAFYKTENELADMQQKCEDSDEYESTIVLKRVVDVDEEDEDEESMGGVYNNEVDYTDGSATEDEQDFSEDKYGPGGDRHELFTLTNLALKQIPGSPKQRATIKKLNKIRVKLGMKPLKEMDIDINDEVNESFKTEVSEEDTIDEIKVFDKLRFKGADKKLALSVVDMIKKKANPKEIAKSFKKLKLPAQELIMKTLGDKSAQDLLQKGQLINQLVSIFDQAEPKGLDGRSKEFRNKIKKLEYNKNKKTKAYEVWGESTELDENTAKFKKLVKDIAKLEKEMAIAVKKGDDKKSAEKKPAEKK